MRPQAFFISIAILRNDGGNAVRARHRQAKACRSPIVKYVERVALETERVGEGQYGVRERRRSTCNAAARGPR